MIYALSSIVYEAQSDITLLEFQQRLTSNPVIANGSRSNQPEVLH